jgi:hypothetical protein
MDHEFVLRPFGVRQIALSGMVNNIKAITAFDQLLISGWMRNR